MLTEKTLTVFTPTYNRAHTLGRCYKSLLGQSSKDFIWMIIDDGSTDGTRELVSRWKERDNGFEIIYIYKENGGMHTAHNTAYDNITTELNVCIDSDDYMTEDAVEKIISFWKENKDMRYAGIIALDAYESGKIVGNGFLEGIKSTTLADYYKHGGIGDKKLVYRTEIMKKYPPYPVFQGEKYVSLAYKYQLCDQEYELLILDDVLCIVEYQEDGSSKTMFQQYVKNPKGFSFIRMQDMKYSDTLLARFKASVHYISSSIFCKNKYFLKESPKKGLTICAIPLGILLSIYIWINAKSGKLMKKS